MTPLELTLTGMAAGGDAIARDADGRVVFVAGALPGERVRVDVIAAKKDFARAVVLDVIDASPDRIAPPCVALAAGCGGCPWQHVRPSAQGRLKADIVVDALRRIAHIEMEVSGPIAGPLRSVRSTARLGVDGAGRAGQRRRQGNDVIPTDACLASHPRLEDLIVRGRFRGASEVVLRVGVASGERAVLVDPDRAGGAVEVPDDVAVGPDSIIHEEVAGAWLQISMGSFFQAGPVAASALVAAVATAIGSALPTGGHLVDAYAGVGLFGATIGRAHGARITSIETHGSAVDDARVNLADLDAVVMQGEVGQWRPRPGEAPADVVVADPSRTGLGRPGVRALVAAGAPRLVLVSCDPASLARDAALLAEAGYRLRSVDLVDAFPDTFHIEAVSVLDLDGP